MDELSTFVLYLLMRMKKNILIASAAIAIMTVTLAGCREKDDMSGFDCTVTNAKYSTDILPIVTASCVKSGCHDAGSSKGDYTTYDGLKAKVDNGTLQERVVEKQNMPKGGDLLPEQRARIKCWIVAGGPNN